MKKKTVKLVSAVVVLGVACGAYVGVNSYVSSQEAKEAEEEDKSVDLISLKADEVTAVSFKADDADVEFDRKDDSWTEKSDADFPVINVEKGSYSSDFTAQWTEDEKLPRILSVKGGFRRNVIPDKAEAVLEGIDLEKIRSACAQYSVESGVAFEAEEKNHKIFVKAKGRAAHASTPEVGANAVTAMVEFLSRLPMADSEGFSKLCAVSRIFPHGDWAGEAAGVKMSDEVSGPLTIAFSVFEYSLTGLIGMFDSRVSLCANNQNMRDVLVDAFGKAEIHLGNLTMRPGHHVPADSPFIRTLLRCYEQYTGKKGECIAIGGGTYTHNLRNGVAFGCADPTVDNHMHGADEFAVIDQLVLSAKIFAQVIIDICQ